MKKHFFKRESYADSDETVAACTFYLLADKKDFVTKDRKKVTCKNCKRTKLFRGENKGKILIYAVNKDSEKVAQGDLITFQNNGTIFRHGAVNKYLGFQLNSCNQIIIMGECQCKKSD